MYTPEVMEEIRLAVIDTATDMAVGQPKDLSDTPAVYQLTMRCAGKVHKSLQFLRQQALTSSQGFQQI